MSDVRLRTEDLSVGYNGRELIRGIALSLRPGEIMTLIGPNGAGKSTILKSVIRQLALVRGTVCLDGRDMAGLREGDVARRMSVVMTSHISPELMTCFDVAAAGRYPYTGRLGILTPEDREKTARCLELVHAAELADQDFSRISDGQRQRVMLARALCQEPEVIVLDEPTAAIDPIEETKIYKKFKEISDERTTVLVTHRLGSARIADRIVVMENGRVAEIGTHDELIHKKGTYYVLFMSQAQWYENQNETGIMPK